MKIIVPMAGRGSRLRPHTLTVPKPLIPIAGKPIVHRLVEDIAGVINQKIEEIAFIIHKDFGKKVEEDLIAIAEKLGSKGTICYQNEALGTAHAILCAKESMSGPIVVAYADTLFRADFTLDTSADSVIWVKQVEDPSAFGVVQLNENNQIVDFVEKPKDFVSDLFRKTILSENDLAKEYIDKTPNWDTERIAEIDTIILKMAICEFLKFPSIPVKVTINEYLEIAKEYSTPKSSIFINGILDNLVKEFQTNNRLNKTGRGLMQ
jgi:transcription antitermination factor NusB